jgi:chromosome segregation ATPase
LVKKVNYLKSLEKDLESAQEKYKALDEINMVNCQKLRDIEINSYRELGELEGKIFEARKLGIDRDNEVRGLEGENERLLRDIGELRERTGELVKRSEMLGQENEVLVLENESLSEQLSRKEIGECFDAGARDLATFGQMDSAQV